MTDDLVTTRPQLKRSLVLIMAVATGVMVANNYYAQPLLPSIGRTFHLSSATAGVMVTVSQVGYVLGIALIVPLGDLLERRRLICLLSALTTCGLIVLGLAPAVGVLYPATFIVGITSCATQVLVPFAATLAEPEERGKVVGTVMSGLLIGILVARTFSGLIAATGSWRTVYIVAAGIMAIETVVLSRVLPTGREQSGIAYRSLIRSLGTIALHERLLQIRALYGLLSFVSFSALWTSVAFLLKSHYHYSVIVIGLFGLIGAAGALAASIAGRASDKGATAVASVIAAVFMLVSWFALLAGKTSIWWLMVGIALLDVGSQSMHITNQGVIYQMKGSIRARLNSVYMISYFIGGVIGSALSATCYELDGWEGVCFVGISAAGISTIMSIGGLLMKRTKQQVVPAN